MKKNTFWKVLAALAAIAALCVVGVKLYRKFNKKKETEALDEAEDLLMPSADDEVEAEEEAFEVPAEAVIANADDMEETPVE